MSMVENVCREHGLQDCDDCATAEWMNAPLGPYQEADPGNAVARILAEELAATKRKLGAALMALEWAERKPYHYGVHVGAYVLKDGRCLASGKIPCAVCREFIDDYEDRLAEDRE